ncbi:MAG: hypothetical protein ACLTC4_13500 [Hungatella hathewayi]
MVEQDISAPAGEDGVATSTISDIIYTNCSEKKKHIAKDGNRIMS